jgi:hypothetical protein
MPLPLLNGETPVLTLGSTSLTNLRVIGPMGGPGSNAEFIGSILIDDVVFCGISPGERHAGLLALAFVFLVLSAGSYSSRLESQVTLVLALMAAAAFLAYLFYIHSILIVQAAGGGSIRQAVRNQQRETFQLINTIQRMKIDRTQFVAMQARA